MSLELFTKIVTELAEGGFPGWFLFGLFGEPLEDPSLEQRLRLIKQLLPQARISIATNCGVYDPGKHAFIVELADDIGVHVEAISPEIYDRLMAPLKAGARLPKDHIASKPRQGEEDTYYHPGSSGKSFRNYEDTRLFRGLWGQGTDVYANRKPVVGRRALE